MRRSRHEILDFEVPIYRTWMRGTFKLIGKLTILFVIIIVSQGVQYLYSVEHLIQSELDKWAGLDSDKKILVSKFNEGCQVITAVDEPPIFNDCAALKGYDEIKAVAERAEEQIIMVAPLRWL
jgi:hypothetical protein